MGSISYMPPFLHAHATNDCSFHCITRYNKTHFFLLPSFATQPIPRGQALGQSLAKPLVYVFSQPQSKPWWERAGKEEGMGEEEEGEEEEREEEDEEEEEGQEEASSGPLGVSSRGSWGAFSEAPGCHLKASWGVLGRCSPV